MTQPWDKDRRARAKAKIDKEAKRAAARLGAEHVLMIAFFPDGDHLHMLDGGEAPMPSGELYAKMATAAAAIAQSGGEDVSFQ